MSDTSVIGTKPNQVPRNSDLGELAYKNSDEVVAPEALAGYWPKAELTKVSQLTNDVEYQTPEGSVAYATLAGTIPADEAVALLSEQVVEAAVFRATSGSVPSRSAPAAAYSSINTESGEPAMAQFTADTTVIFTGESYEAAQAQLLAFYRSLPGVRVQRVSLVEWDVPPPPVVIPPAPTE